MQPGDNVLVPDDDSGECVFIGPGDPDEAVTVAHPGIVGGNYKREVGRVRYPDGTIKNWQYKDIRPLTFPEPDVRELSELQAWFREQGFSLLLSETKGVGKAYAHVFALEPHELRRIVTGTSMLDAAKRARDELEVGTTAVQKASGARAIASGDDDRSAQRDEPKDAPSPAPQSLELLDLYSYTIVWRRDGPTDPVWLVQVYDADGKFLDGGLGDNMDDALLAVAERLTPPAGD